MVERHTQGWNALQLGAIDVGGDREEPGGEAAFAAPLPESAPGAKERLLGHLFGAAAIAAVAPGHVDERPLPALNNLCKGLQIAGEDAFDQSRIERCTGG